MENVGNMLTETFKLESSNITNFNSNQVWIQDSQRSVGTIANPNRHTYFILLTGVQNIDIPTRDTPNDWESPKN